MTRRILIFRRDLFRPSETFITQQGEAHSWEHTYVGARRFGPAPPGAHHLLLGDAELRSVLRKGNIDVVHAHFGLDVAPAKKIADVVGAPLVVTLHGFDVTRTRRSCIQSGRPNLVRYGLRRPSVLRKPDMCLAVSEFIRDQALSCGVQPERLYLHHIGTSLEGLPVSRSTRSRFKRDEVVISHVARLVEKKGTAFLIRALAEISCKYESRFKLRIAGDGPLLGDLKALASGLGVGDRVTFLGSQTHSEAIATIAESDIFCLPSVSAKDGDAEGLGMVLLEAAAVGTPIVAARSGGIMDFVKENETGRLVMPGDVASLARGLMRAEAEPAISLRLAETARVVVEESFDVKRQTAELERRLDTLLDRE